MSELQLKEMIEESWNTRDSINATTTGEIKSAIEKTLKLLETMGYYAAEAIFEFCEKNPGMYLMSFVLGKNSEDITDEFEKMKTHSEEIKKDYI